MAGGNKPVEVLLVQDDPADEMLAREDLASNKVANDLVVAHDAAAAAIYLDRAVPDLVLFDIDLREGRAVLDRLGAAGVPVVLLTDSPAAEDILRARRLPVHGYARKPLDFDCLVTIVKSLDSLGFEIRRAA